MGFILLMLAFLKAGLSQNADLFPGEKIIVERTNAARIRESVAPLAVDETLQASARKHCIWMAEHHSMTHSPATSRVGVAENISYGQRNSVGAVDTWMHSPGHRANILNPRYTRIGAACYVTPNGVRYYCEQFGR